MTTRFPALELARGWLSVALAAADDDARPALHRTVSVELYPEGVRLVATDSYLILHTFVANAAHSILDAPSLDELPITTGIAIDEHGRGKGFLAHAAKLDKAARKEHAAPIEVDLSIGVADTEDEDQLSGFESTFVTLSLPDAERIKLRTYDGSFPAWRTLALGHKAVSTKMVTLSPDIIGRLGKLGKLHEGAAIEWHFGGANGPARLVMDCDQPVYGAVMPVHTEEARAAA